MQREAPLNYNVQRCLLPILGSPCELRILCVHSDKSFAALMASACKKLGHRATSSVSGDEALFELREGDYDAAIVDMGADGHRGLGLWDAVREIAFPPMPMAFSAGRCQDPKLLAKAESLAPLLPKVWTHADLRVVLKDLQKRVRAQTVETEATEDDTLATADREAEVNVEVQGDLTGALQRALHEPPGEKPTSRFEGQFATGTGPMPKEALEQAVGMAPKVQMGRQKIFIPLASWTDVARLCSDLLEGIRTITLRTSHTLAADEEIILSLGLPDEMALSIVSRSLRGARPLSNAKVDGQLELTGLSDESLAYMIDRCRSEGAWAQPPAKVAEPARADALPEPVMIDEEVPSSRDSVDIDPLSLDLPKIAWNED